MQRLLAPAAVVLILTACGGSNGNGIFARAERGLGTMRSGTVEVRLEVQALVRLERTAKLKAEDVPLRRLHLTRWVHDSRRYECAAELECARADLDVEEALHELDPVLPQLPIDPDAIRSAEVEIGVRRSDDRPRFLRFRGEIESESFPSDVPFEAELKLPR